MANTCKLSVEMQDWLKNTAWKKMTIQQIHDQTKIPVPSLCVFFRNNNIEPMTQRDFVAEEVIRACNSGDELKICALAKKIGSSTNTINAIIKEYGLHNFFEKKTLVKKKNSTFNNEMDKKIKEYERMINEKKERRSMFAVYNQTGSPLLDEARNINTTKREKTLLSNGMV